MIRPDDDIGGWANGATLWNEGVAPSLVVVGPGSDGPRVQELLATLLGGVNLLPLAGVLSSRGP